MTEKALKIVPAPEAKTSPGTKTEAAAASSLFARIGRKRLRMILLVGVPALALVIGLAIYLSGGRYIYRPTTLTSAPKRC
jgi:membrane fusion protein, multidrug efflux system